jgi:hypothetical protein
MSTPVKIPSTDPPESKEARPCPAALPSNQTFSGYHPGLDFQAELERRVGDIASIRELLPRVLAITRAQGTSDFEASRPLLLADQHGAPIQGDLFDNAEVNKP